MTIPAHPADRPRHVVLFVNPRAGSWRRKRIAALTAAFEAAGATVTTVTGLDEARALMDDADHVCAVGGDGTARQVAAVVGRGDRQPSMSVFPLGTVNLLARECGYSSEPDAFVRRVMADVPKRHYSAVIDGMVMLCCASVGPDSRAVDRVSPRLKRRIGRAAYAVAFATLLVRWRRERMHVAVEGRAIACDAVYVAKGRYFAGGWSVAPAASVERPLLHVVMLERAGRLAFLRFAWAIVRGRDPVNVIRVTCTALEITGGDRAPVQVDGDIVAHLPVRISVAAEALAFS